MSRIKSIKKELKMGEHDQLDMPPCDAQYIVGILFEVGPTMAAGMGDGPITHGEIESWQRNTGIELDAWESRTLRRLSIDYMSASHKAKEIDAEAPWLDAPYLKPAPNRIAERVRNSIRELAKL